MAGYRRPRMRSVPRRCVPDESIRNQKRTHDRHQRAWTATRRKVGRVPDGPGKIETGKIKSWNDRVVFVVYRFTDSDENEVIRQARVWCDGNSHRIFL